MVLENHKSPSRPGKLVFRQIKVYDCVFLTTNNRKTMKLDQYAAMRAMQTAHNMTNQPILDAMLNDADHGPQIRAEVLTKRIQFDTNPALFAKLESVCALLDCSKREFLEMAVIDAIDRAETTFGDVFQNVYGKAFEDVFAAKE
jgi:hypothetical protein